MSNAATKARAIAQLLPCASVFVALLSAAPVGAQRPRLTVDRLVASPSLTGTSPVAPAWAPDSRHLAFLWNARALPTRELWIVERGASEPRRLTSESDAAGARPAPIGGFSWSPDSRTLVYLQGGDLWRIGVAGGAAERLTSDGGGKSAIAHSPDGRWLSFLRDGDLWLLPSTGGEAVRASFVAVPPIGTVGFGTYHAPDVEIGQATWGGAPPYVWSPDSRHVAVHQVDRRTVRQTAFPYYLGEEATMNMLRRGAPGDSNEVRRIGLYDVATRRLAFLELPHPSERRVVDYAWSPRGELLIDRESDDAIDRWLHLATSDGAVRDIWHDRRETRIYNDIASTWHPDGRRVVITGDLDDRYRLYAITPGDTVPRPLTSAEYDVAGRATAVPATRSLVYVSSEPSPSERHVWRVGAEGGRAQRLTTKPGINTPFVSPDGRTLAFLHTDDVTPSELWLADVATPAAARRITTSPPHEFAEVPWIRGQYVTFPSRTEQRTLHARILEPPNLDRTKRHPVLFGPVYSNTVRNRWAGLYGTLQQMLAIEHGYIIVQVDVRGSTGYGREFREQFLMDWGGGDLEDLESAVAYIKTLPWVDGDRMGIWGSSYGGTLTVYSLFRKPGLFKAGVAGAPAVDPRYFGSDDVAIVRRPQSHPEAFRRGALQYAANLQDHLLIIHGMQDDVVPFQTSVQLAEELMRLGKDFDFAFAPAATHGWTQRSHYARYLLGKLVGHFERYLKPAGGP